MSAEIIFGALEYLFILSLFFRINDTHGFLFWAKSFLFENFSSVSENFTCSASHIRQESSLNSGIFSEFGLIQGRLSILFYSCFPKPLFCFLFENFLSILENRVHAVQVIYWIPVTSYPASSTAAFSIASVTPSAHSTDAVPASRSTEAVTPSMPFRALST